MMALRKLARSLAPGLCACMVFATLPANVSAADAPAPATNAPAWLAKPLSIEECLNLALTQNSAILKSQKDLEAAYGIVVQTRAIAIPKVRAQSQYKIIDQDSIDKFPFSGIPGLNIDYPDQSWNANVTLSQSIYEGGRVNSALRAARLTKDQALLGHQAAIADNLLEVRLAYADILLAAQLITVQEASVKLLTRELEDTKRRFEAGTVPRFNVLRAEVEVANARPRLIKARNSYRVAKSNMANLLGYNVPKDIWEDIPLQLTATLEDMATPYDIDLTSALGQAIERRPELGALKKAIRLRQENLVSAKAGYKPSVQLIGGYGSRSSSFSSDLGHDVTGWFAGAQASWDIFDGFLTKGKVDEARARYQKSQVDFDDTTRRVELEVRTTYSNFIEAREVLESQKKVQEQAEEALRLATARSEAGTSTQLDVLSAQTSLTEARTTQIQALRDYSAARSRLERAIGQSYTVNTVAK
jgi:outer membrane protein